VRVIYDGAETEPERAEEVQVARRKAGASSNGRRVPRGPGPWPLLRTMNGRSRAEVALEIRAAI
jgi:hypothetical protein